MLPILLASLLGCGDLCGSQAVAHYAELLARGGYGRLPIERAAFLINEGGSIAIERWDSSEFQKASFRGRIPRGTMAIVHTHPLKSPQPSAGDVLEAVRTGLPVIVVAPRGVTAAFPDGSVVRLISRPQWWRHDSDGIRNPSRMDSR